MPVDQPTGPTGPPPEDPEPTRPRGRRALPAIVAVVVVLAAVGVTLALTLGSNGNNNTQTSAQRSPGPTPSPGATGGGSIFPTTTIPQSSTPQGQSPTQTTPASLLPGQTQSTSKIGPSYTWIGMTLSATPNGVTVATLDIGGAADTAGINPGDVISQVDHTTIGSIAQLQSATQNLTIGQSFTLTVDRGTTAVVLNATLTNRPTKQP